MYQGGLTTPRTARHRRRAESTNVPTVKVTGGQRIDLLGVKKEDLPDLGRSRQGRHGFRPCAYGGEDPHREDLRRRRALPLRHPIGHGHGRQAGEDALRHVRPHKVKLAVSGCPRNCAEAGIKDVGVIGVDSGYEIYVAGNGGIKTEVAQFLVKVGSDDEVLEYAGAFLQLYREEGTTSTAPATTVGRSASTTSRAASSRTKTDARPLCRLRDAPRTPGTLGRARRRQAEARIRNLGSLRRTP